MTSLRVFFCFSVDDVNKDFLLFFLNDVIKVLVDFLVLNDVIKELDPFFSLLTLNDVIKDLVDFLGP